MTRFTRRSLIAGAAVLAALTPLRAGAQFAAAMDRGMVLAGDFGLVPGFSGANNEDQSQKLAEAMRAAAASGLPLFLPAGSYAVGGVDVPAGLSISGIRGATRLVAIGDGPILRIGGGAVTLRDLAFDGGGRGAGHDAPALITVENATSVLLENLDLTNGRGSGIVLSQSIGRIAGCSFADMGASAIHADDAIELAISANRIERCGNGGIRVWGSGRFPYRGVGVTDNDISDIRSDGGGNGQNGNGINVFRADGVIVSGNRLRNCAFSAIRLNSTDDTIVIANNCLDSGEVAIFSEFGFSGSVIADNIIDRAALGISMTNFNEGGRLATCTGNIVRNIAPRSLVNPDTVPVGIAAEADAIIANNVVDAVPGTGISVGWGPYLRDVTVSGNLVRDVEIGIGVSVADGAGGATITANRIAGARRAAVAGTAWHEIASDDLERDAGRYPALAISGNTRS